MRLKYNRNGWIFECSLNNDDTISVLNSNSFIGKYQLITEPFCEKCSLPLNPEDPFCDNCWNVASNYSFDFAKAVGLYFKWGYDGNIPYIKKPEADLLSTHIRYLKNKRNYSYNIRWAIPLGLAMCLCIKDRFIKLKSVNSIVPIPQHPNSMNRRGYNQAEEIAKVVSKVLDIPLRTDILTKVNDINMRGKNLEERKELVEGAYECFQEINEEIILLIDDTFTTGSNSDECAKVLKRNGAKHVYVMVAGRDVFEY
ncbi:MAG: ComF family protein [Spirochaetes bacterium]|nr:ComF family protein [Spirochaetota bacterium]